MLRMSEGFQAFFGYAAVRKPKISLRAGNSPSSTRQGLGFPQLPGAPDLRSVGFGRRLRLGLVEERDAALAQSQRFGGEPGIDLGVNGAEHDFPDRAADHHVAVAA